MSSLCPPAVPGTSCAVCNVWLNHVAVAALPRFVSRHNADARPHAITRAVSSGLRGRGDEVIVMVCQESEAFASACAIARAYPLFNEKRISNDSGEGKELAYVKARTVTVEFLLAGVDKGKKLMSGSEKAMTAAAAGLQTLLYFESTCHILHRYQIGC